MIGLILTQLALFLAVGVIGFFAGMRLRAWSYSLHVRGIERDIVSLSRALNAVQARRARGA